MTDEERRLLRLENADATLAELLAKQDERMHSLEQLAAKQDERMGNLEQLNAGQQEIVVELARLVAKQQERTASLEDSFKVLVELARNAHERADQHQSWINELGAAQAKQQERAASLEESFKMLVELARGASGRADQHQSWINELGAAQADSDAKLAALTDAQIRADEAQARQQERTASLEDSFKMLVELARGASERADQHQSWINQLGATQADSDARIAALTDAQIRTEEAEAKHRERTAGLEDAFKMLVELARSASERVDQHQSWINELGAAQANLNAKFADFDRRADESR